MSQFGRRKNVWMIRKASAWRLIEFKVVLSVSFLSRNMAHMKSSILKSSSSVANLNPKMRQFFLDTVNELGDGFHSLEEFRDPRILFFHMGNARP